MKVIDLGKMDYSEALKIQEALMAERISGLGVDTLLLVEHPPVLTLGRRGEYSNILAAKEYLESLGVSVYEVSRGGDVTYHGPGQIVGYPIMNLETYGKDIKQFIWKLEEIFIRLLRDLYQVEATRDEKKYTGVWVGDEKITAIGVAVKHWVTMHGFAFNVNTDLSHFNWINPCGITDKGVTSLKRITGTEVDLEDMKEKVAKYFLEVFEI
jgi:lipoyl(octanoyl) transferase